MHWLAVEGTQPKTPLNPLSVSTAEEAEDCSNDVDVLDASEGKIENGSSRSSRNSYKNTDNVAIRNLLPRLLSEELQLYFTQITMTLQRNDDPQAQDAAILRLRNDKIQELVPFFFNFLTPKDNAQVANVQQSLLRIQCVHSLALNPYIHLELYLEKVILLVMNCIVPKTLSFSQYDHWKLRDEASRTLLAIWKIFGEKYASLQPSVIRILCEALTHGLESRYGALVALGNLGAKVVDAVVLPHVGRFWTECEMQLQQTQDPGIRYALQRVLDAILVSKFSFSATK